MGVLYENKKFLSISKNNKTYRAKIFGIFIAHVIVLTFKIRYNGNSRWILTNEDINEFKGFKV